MRPTLVLLALTAAGFVAGAVLAVVDPRLLILLMLNNEAVLKGAYYELLTSVFVTPSFTDFALNAIALYVLYRIYNSEAGPVEYVAFFAAALAGNFATVAVLPPRTLSAGASGGIFGLFSYYVVADMMKSRQANWVGPAFLGALFLSSAILPQVNWVAHLGGILGGSAVALAERALAGGRKSN